MEHYEDRAARLVAVAQKLGMSAADRMLIEDLVLDVRTDIALGLILVHIEDRIGKGVISSEDAESYLANLEIQADQKEGLCAKYTEWRGRHSTSTGRGVPKRCG